MTSLRLLPKDELITTGPVDHADWNFSPLIGHIQRARFDLIDRLIGSRRFEALLEIGYGSGVFMPHLATLARRVCGIDIHPHSQQVEQVLGRHGVRAELATGSATSMPYPAATFDAVVCISSLEFVDDAQAACREIARILRPGGRLFVVVPKDSPFTTAGLKIFTGQSAASEYGDRRQRLRDALDSTFATKRTLSYPGYVPESFRVYVATEFGTGE